MPFGLQNRFGFLISVGEARGRGRFDLGESPATLEEKIHRTFGYGWHLAWNLERHCWCILRNAYGIPDIVKEFRTPTGDLLPLTSECIGQIRKALEFNADPKHMELARRLGEKHAAEYEEEKLRTFREEFIRELLNMRRLRNSIVIPKGYGVVKNGLQC